ncbi:hypothetical protein MIND_01172100 [Mycena indigotica]|uniref:Uncharacterized protein n=1 Tax=Mycena indigotica TaxID=2126181 RepID=A0A8H6S4R4_9AGAR|nr:uncharacterized protein MIND_01172100 [Mycena indigotica]KAF7292738.1 hypothetical protein MIND_01172100 [Mycena indigotica]
MSRSPIELRFEGSQTSTFSARMWRIPGVDGPFTALHTTEHAFTIAPNSVFINNYAGYHRTVMKLDEAKRWGLVEDSRLVFARARASNGQLFCLRFIFHADRVARKGDPTRNQRFIRALIDDAKFYLENLQTVAGVLVPQNYGMWVMDTGDWAGKVLFSLTEWCGIPWKTLIGTKLDTRANRQLVARTLEMFHDLGVKINGKRHLGSDEDFTHILLDIDDPHPTSEMAASGQARCFIADFAHAKRHKCRRTLPLVSLGNDAFNLLVSSLRLNMCCRELENAAFLLGLMPARPYKTDPPETPIEEAIKWHADYSAAHPSYPNSVVLIAQRAALFPSSLPLYPGLEVSGPSKENVDVKLTLYDRSQGFINPTRFLKCFSREDYEYHLWGDKMEVKPVALNAQPPRELLESADDDSDSDSTSSRSDSDY